MTSRRKSRPHSPTWDQRELAALQKELKGAKRWLLTLRTQLKRSPEDRWALGMLAHYTKREKALTDKIALLTTASD